MTNDLNKEPIETYDLASVQPPKRQLKLRDGREVEVLPPTVGQILSLTTAAKELNAAQDDEDKALAAFSKIVATLKLVIPAMNDKDDPVDFTVPELQEVMGFVFKMGQSPDTKKLNEMGIKPVEGQKKIPSDT